jgi:hypothetical protein
MSVDGTSQEREEISQSCAACRVWNYPLLVPGIFCRPAKGDLSILIYLFFLITIMLSIRSSSHFSRPVLARCTYLSSGGKVQNLFDFAFGPGLTSGSPCWAAAGSRALRAGHRALRKWCSQWSWRRMRPTSFPWSRTSATPGARAGEAQSRSMPLPSVV